MHSLHAASSPIPPQTCIALLCLLTKLTHCQNDNSRTPLAYSRQDDFCLQSTNWATWWAMEKRHRRLTLHCKNALFSVICHTPHPSRIRFG